MNPVTMVTQAAGHATTWPEAFQMVGTVIVCGIVAIVYIKSIFG